MKKLLTLLFLGLSCSAFAQTVKVSGTVTGSDRTTLPGVYVMEENTSNAVSTDLDGYYSLDAKVGSNLLFSYIGYKTQIIPVTGAAVINVILEEDSALLEEVVVVGYGTQKKSVVTAAIAKVSSDDLKNVAPVRIDNALKGLTSGVTVTSSSGQPGASARVRVRGVGTINNSEPLYIVDGMPIGGGIDYLNPSDIQSIEVLKDAASGAVYGARAANGVILVTTKSGQKGATRVTYDFSYGFQNPWKEYDVLNATEYALLMNEGYLAQGKAPVYSDPYALGEGTDWQKEIFNYNAPQINHQLTISGASEKVSYYISAGYYSQDGIVGGNFNRSNYERLTIRTNTTYTLMDQSAKRNFLHKFTMGINAAYSRNTSFGITTNSEFGGPLGSALGMAPTLKVYADDPEALLAEHPTAVKDPRNGKPFSIVEGSIYNEMVNPLASLSLPGTKGNSDKLVSNFWGELSIWDNLKIKSSLGIDLAFWGNDGWSPAYFLSTKNFREYSEVWSSMNRSLVWQVENVLSYEKQFGSHFIQALVGQSAQGNMGQNLSGGNRYLQEEDPYKANMGFATGTQEYQTASGYVYTPHRLASLFARVSYNFAERYMLQATVRRDGSSNFGLNNLYAIFPSASVGWNFTNENFLANRPQWFSTGKLRASWGKNGNESIGQFKYTTTMASGNNYPFGNPGVVNTGAKPNGFANADIRWEESTQTDIGLDLAFFSSALTFSVDWYKKKTTGMLMDIPVPAYSGDSAPTGNVGIMENSGWEFDLRYRFSLGDAHFNIGANATYLNNLLVELGNENGWQNYDSHKIGTLTRAQNGYPFPFFYGWKTNGLFQNWAEVEAGIQPNAQPGDVRFVDLDNNGVINDDDRTMIGKGMPDWTFGFNLGFNWKGFDFNAFFQGVYGVDVYNVTRRTDLYYINLPSYMMNRWTGENSSDRIPRFSFESANENWRASDLWVEDGSYLRLKNIQLGYTLPSHLTRKIFIANLRVYVAGENILTFTNYSGFDPEIASGGTSLGIDRGVYPQSKVYTLGISLTF
ncbi:MAG: TonB-dependent receptor [Bacteroidales bacterium]|nr:TonB-dependent receptor [Bacteroidales bacterium]MDD4029957.1 TonB-dependent receptor [Bacteroidales bacterium]MDD4434732.1 TonB-dependent receptor [Bacteroidales bacterium]